MKKLLSIILVIISVFGIAFAFTACGEEESGNFYTVTEAYEKGYLTREEVMSIAYYHNGGIEGNEEIMIEDYKPLPKTPEELPAETERAIKQTFWKNYCKNDEEAEFSNIKIVEYDGVYNDGVAVMIEGYFGFTGAEWIEKVGGINILYTSSNRIEIWRKKI